MKMMQGACFFAFSNMSRTRAAPTPTNISTKSEPEIEKNGTLASPAIALASSVLPVPGEPTISTPRGMRPPSFWNLEGSRRNSTSSWTSSLASSQPATSTKVMLLLLSSSMRARLLPKLNAPPRPPPCICRMKKIQTPIRSSIGNQDTKIDVSSDCSSRGLTSTLTPALMRSPIRPRSSTVAMVRMRRSSCVNATISGVTPDSWIVTCFSRPAFTSDRNSEYGR
jgi:hypothetical protein